jgi:Ca-activated chloride channel family protein
VFRHLLGTAALAATLAAPLAAQGWIDVERPIRPGPLPGNVVRVSSSVRTVIEGRVARVEVAEQFRNGGGVLAEGTYLYPMPGEAVFTDFSLWMGEREVRGEMMNADQARGIYETIVRRLRDPALLTLEGHGLIRARVFPIQPGETRRVVLRYTQVLQRAGDAYRIRYAIGRRDPASGRGLYDGAPATAGTFSYTVTVPSAGDFGTPYSPTHQVHVRRDGGRLEVTLDPDAEGDVELFLPVRHGLVGTSVVTYAPGGEDGYFLLLLSPPATAEETPLPRDLSLVIDVSGSMSGPKLDQAKAAIAQALGTLRPADRFRLIAFSTMVTNFRDGFTPATPENLRAARAFVERLAPNGGTNIRGALEAVLGSAVSEERLPLVLFLTDGLPTVGETAPDRIADYAAGHVGRSRLFTVGVGMDVNTYLLDRLAQQGRGSAEYVAPDASIEVALGQVLGKIEHPALINLRLTATPVGVTQVYPGDLPDLFYGEELVAVGRYHGAGAGDVVITGERNGRRETFTARAEFPATEAGNDFVAKLWASRRIGELTRQIRIEGATPSLVEQVRELGLRYGILTEYTAYLVQEPTSTAWNAPMPQRAMALDQAAVGGVAAAPAQTGREAFQRARASAGLSGAGNLAAAEKVASARAAEIAAATPGSADAMRRVGGRLFVHRSGVWTDAALRDTLNVARVQAFSEAYFALVRALPELAPWLGAGDEIVIAGRRASVRIGAAGSAEWRPGELETLVRNFRGA